MSKFPLDLSKFKRVASDKYTTTLRHERGHELKLAHGGLSRDVQEKLKKLPQCYAEGTPEVPVGEENDSSDQQAAPQPQQNQPTVVINNTPQQPPEKSYAVQQAPQPQRAPSNVQELLDQHNASVGPSSVMPAPAPAASPMATPPGQMPTAPAAGGYDPYAGFSAQLKGIQEQRRGETMGAEALGQLGKQEAAQETGYQNQMQEKIDAYNRANDDLSRERQAMQADLSNGHIDPDNYIKSMSTGGRIMQDIGLILGGMGAGLTGGPNYAFQSLQSNIDRDIQSQKDNLGKKQSLLSSNLAQTQNLRQAMDLTRLQMNDLLSSKIKASIAQMQDPIQKAAAIKANGLLEGTAGQIQQNMAVQRAMMGGMSGQADPESAFQSRMQLLRMRGQNDFAKDMEAKHAAGIPGQASVELTPDNRDELRGKALFDQKIGEYLDFAEKHGNSLDPRVAAQGKVKAAELQSLYRQATHGGVYKEGEAHFIDQLIDSNPAKFMNTLRGVKAKAKELQSSNRESLNNLKSSLGFPASATQQTAAQPQYKIVGGVKYMRGPNGEAIRVK